MQTPANIKVLFIAGFGPIGRNTGESRKLYLDVLGIPFKQETDGYLHSEAVPGAKSFALWPLSQAARSCFGKDTWPADIDAPQAWLEFDVESVEAATPFLFDSGKRTICTRISSAGKSSPRHVPILGVAVRTACPGLSEGFLDGTVIYLLLPFAAP
jgi:hypothetical protein